MPQGSTDGTFRETHNVHQFRFRSAAPRFGHRRRGVSTLFISAAVGPVSQFI
jgi:hypothetical protein